MANRYRSRIISSTLPTANTTQASGIWPLDEMISLGSTWPAPFNSIQFVVVAGGGGGGSRLWYAGYGGGGGAGGYISSVPGEVSGGNTAVLQAAAIASGVTYTITVGAGGTGTANGANSSIVGNGMSLIATGGGYGASVYVDYSGGNVGANGGSGGGGAYYPSYPRANGTGIAGQGTNGGVYSTSYNVGAGGGGALATAAAVNNSSSNPGGAGITTNIIGSSATYGVGGDGKGEGQNGIAGAVNTGDGGDARANTSGGGFNGGSGIVIIRISSSFPLPAAVTGTYTTGTTGSYRYYRWTTSGTIRWSY